ncbi:MAG: hypothetical protein DME61_05830 [Verrucomicrobia bacterium]|nr:MAG: hypothetical protein DME61_05830 [Verrucomicrobiota bacterium]
MPSPVTLPKQLPVMPLPGAVVFPHALLPLYIFEPRYRNMLEHALRHHRMFCVTLIKPSCPDWHAPEDFFHLATVGLIRACVGRSDGTSNLILQGLQRVRFTSFEQETPFPIARIEIVESHDATTVETEALGAKPYGLDIRERSVATATRARRTFSQSTPPFPHHVFARRNRKRRCIGRDSALRDALGFYSDVAMQSAAELC